MSSVHFIGFHTDLQYWAAVAVWGKPDFIHRVHDRRVYGDVDPDVDVLVFAGNQSPGKIIDYSYNDSEYM